MSSSPQGVLFFQADNWLSRAAYPAGSEVIQWTAGEYPNGEQWVKLNPSEPATFESIQVLARFKSFELGLDQYSADRANISNDANNSNNAASLSDQIFRLLLLLEALNHRTPHLKLFLPYLPYSLQDRDVRGGDGVGVKTLISCLEAIGVDEFQVIDLHSAQDLAYFTVPVTHWTAEQLLADQIRSVIQPSDLAVVAPDKGATLKAQNFGELLKAPVTYLQKKRLGPGKVEIIADNLRDLKAKHILLVDDLLNTGGTLVTSAQVIREQIGAEVSVAVTHGLFANQAMKKLSQAGIKHIFVTDSYEGKTTTKSDLIQEVSVLDLIWPE